MEDILSFVWGFVVVFFGGLFLYKKFLNYIDDKECGCKINKTKKKEK